ncbi:hypothetical protein J7L70_04355 [Candidatus Bathyarchaeota archaeon]|nr:hypothetical protein [Candidatus Bathyarchaeota archaeon]
MGAESSKIKTVVEVLAVIVFIALLTHVYCTILGGIPYELLETVFKRANVDLTYGTQAWVDEDLGSPNKSLHLALVNLFLSFLTSTGLSVYSTGVVFLTLLWVSGGLSVYVLFKRLMSSRSAALIASVAYLGSPLAIKCLWNGLETALFYALIPVAITLADKGFRKNSMYYGFYVALAATILSGGVYRLDLLTLFILTIPSYLVALITDQWDLAKFKWITTFTSSTVLCWIPMNLWLIIISPVFYENFNVEYLVVAPLFFLLILTALKVKNSNVLQASAVLLITVIMLFDPQGIVSTNVYPDALTLLCVSLSLSLASCLKRLLQRLEDYLSMTLIIESDEGIKRKYNLSKPIFCIIVIGLIISQGVAVSLAWYNDLNIPSLYVKLNKALPKGHYRVLTLPITCREIFYNWSPRSYSEHIESIVLNKSVISGCDHVYLNELSTKKGFWKLLSIFDIKFLMLHMDINCEKTKCVNPKILKNSIEKTRLSYENAVFPHVRNGSVELSYVKSLTEDFGFVHLVNYNSSKIHRVEARVSNTKEAQSKIHIYALGAIAQSNEPILNGTFSFAYDPRVLEWSEYRYLELWIKVNGSHEVEIQLYDAFYNWSLWKVEVEEQVWSLVTIRLDKPDVYGGLDESKVCMVVFSVRAPPDRIVEVEVGGIFLDYGYEVRVAKKPEPLKIFMEKPELVIYELPDRFRNPKIYTVERTIPLNNTGRSTCEIFLSEEFDPQTSAFVEKEELNVFRVKISYSERGPLHYGVTVYRPTGPFLLVLNERFDPGWSIYIEEPSLIDVFMGMEARNTEHLRVNGFFNGWYIKPGGETLTLVILYRPQVLLEVFKTISLGFAVVGLTIGFLRRLLEVDFSAYVDID